MMKLLRFRVTNFRSVEDSGWIDTDNVTALIGTNESGKTNLLVPLWKLNPAKDGKINPISDFPRKRYNEIRAMKDKPIFIEAQFELSNDIASSVADIADVTADDVRVTLVKRDFDGSHWISFPNASPTRHLSKDEILPFFLEAYTTVDNLVVDEQQGDLKKKGLDTISAIQQYLQDVPEDIIDITVMTEIRAKLDTLSHEENDSEQSEIETCYINLIAKIDETILRITKPHPNEVKEAKEIVLNHLPSFVYYSNYGNLDSEIYLPHVIENMKRTDLGSREEAKARTLKVLFDFVNLKPEEIHALGYDYDPRNGHNPNQDQIKEIAEKKKEREILLQSASTELTKKFRSWWKQGDYRFRFDADGNHFRIWVADDRRPEEIELEGRSTGLQWFLSFYLVFLVESTGTHKDAILLLDEPGLSLHPLAQEDLSNFFESLSQTNQLLYTTHSPFLVDPDHLDRVKAVYIDQNGETVVSANLRASQDNPAQSHSIYPVHAALGLSVSMTLLQGCQSVIVDGTSDQLYLSAMKNYLINKGLLTPKYELLFMPAGGVRGVTAIASLLSAKDETPPFVIADSDRSGRDVATKLKTSLYQGKTERIVMIGEICNLAEAEIEDVFPTDFLADIITRYFPRRDEDFSDVVEEDKPIIPQIEAYAARYNITLETGWKVEIAKEVKARMVKSDPFKRDTAKLEMWRELFAKITAEIPLSAIAKRSSRN